LASHFAGARLEQMAGIKLTHVPYRGAGPALLDVLGGHVPILVSNISVAAPDAAIGRLRLLAVTSPERSSIFPDVPTVAESGLPGFEALQWFGVYAPAGTPREIVARLNSDIGKILRMPDIRERFSSLGADIAGGSAEDFAAFQRLEVARWTKIVKASGAKIE
ncbi:MAG TPA: tripartite tricarboxylate transporter substrate-binding protein, partial [Burkholderiales bacterium]|nr:tripartite tricarboxylate transporter substrate-binding protein [Burkholderiales bacterium]